MNIKIKLGFILLGGLMLIAATGCGSSAVQSQSATTQTESAKAESTNTESAKSARYVCSLLSKSEVEAVLDMPLMEPAGDESSCVYKETKYETEVAGIGVDWKDASTAMAGNKLAYAMMGTLKPVPGIGDEAYVLYLKDEEKISPDTGYDPNGILYFRKNDVVVSFNVKSNKDSRDKTKVLAQKVAAKL